MGLKQLILIWVVLLNAVLVSAETFECIIDDLSARKISRETLIFHEHRLYAAFLGSDLAKLLGGVEEAQDEPDEESHGVKIFEKRTALEIRVLGLSFQGVQGNLRNWKYMDAKTPARDTKTHKRVGYCTSFEAAIK